MCGDDAPVLDECRLLKAAYERLSQDVASFDARTPAAWETEAKTMLGSLGKLRATAAARSL